jgi:hypothetical protein
LHGVDGADLPAAQNGVGDSVAAAEESAAVTKGQLVDKACDGGQITSTFEPRILLQGAARLRKPLSLNWRFHLL